MATHKNFMKVFQINIDSFWLWIVVAVDSGLEPESETGTAPRGTQELKIVFPHTLLKRLSLIKSSLFAMSPTLPVSVPGPGARVPVVLRVHRAEHHGLHVGDDVRPRVRPVVRHHVAHVSAAHPQHVARHRKHGGVRHEAGGPQSAAVHDHVKLLVLGCGLSQTCKRCLAEYAATTTYSSL